MSYSGHHPYYDVTESDKIKSPMVYRNREIVDNLPVSSRVRGYIAANLELENMLTQLLDSLEEAGCLENTFSCYNAGMKENVIVDSPCCTVDIVPTLLNLFGVDYDSRLLAGTDILDSNSFHVAMLYNQSFITDKIKYNTTNGKMTYLVDKESVTQEYMEPALVILRINSRCPFRL